MKRKLQLSSFIKISCIAIVAMLSCFEVSAQSQSPSITSGVTFQWEDVQNGENNNPATIKSVTVGSEVYNTFVVPSNYQLTRLGSAGHNNNGIVRNGAFLIGNSSTATLNINDSNAWDDRAIDAFQDKNLNHYFTANPNGANFCGNFSAAATTNAQKQTLFYSPAIPSNQDGVLAVTERGGNNCYYIEMWGTPAGGGAEQKLGETFVRTSGDLRGGGFSAPANGSDYWGSGREQDNGQTIAVALFELNNIAPVGSKISRVEFVAASSDHGDGKLFILQKYAVDQLEIGCLDEMFEGNIDLSNNVPDGSHYTLVDGPSPAGSAFNLNGDGTFSYTPQPGFTGNVVFEYQVCLPAPNSSVCDRAFVTLNYVSPPEAAIVDLDCNANGTTNLIVTSPLGSNLEYSINNGPFQSNTTFSNLPEGSYIVTVRDINTGCFQASSSGFVIENLEVAVPIDVTDVTCFGGNDGEIDLEPSGGTPPYEFEWSNGATTEDLTGLSVGSYTVVVTDSYGCELEATAVVSGPAKAVSIKPDTVITDVSCFDGDDGAINITPDGGTAPYTYIWSNGATTQDISNLEAGSYTVTVVDANSCEVEGTFSVEQPTAALSIADTITNVLCNGDSSGVVQLTVSGGTAPYTYEWSDGSTAANLEDVAAGSYSVVVTDANDCEIQQSFTIIEPDSPLSINLTRENATTAQNCVDGTATAAVTGGTAPYSYLWSNGATVASISDLSDGTYSVTVTDANGCELTQSVVVDCINTCDAVIAIGTVTDVLCASEETGSTTVSASSEANPGALFTFTWSNGEVDAGVTSSTLNNIGAGVYTVSVTIDGTVCQPVEQSVTVSEPSSAVGVTISTEDETGPGLSNGEATASATGGVAPYTYSWSNGATTAQIDNLSPGDYTVEVTDDNGCTVESTVTINPGSCNNLSITTSVENVSCNGFSDGSVGSNTTGGVGPFTYSWSNGATTENINNVEAGNYTVTVTDTFTNCTAQSTVAVNEPTVLSAGIAVNNVLCFGESTGSLNLTVSGGTLDYTYEWSSGQTIEDLTGLPAGSYSVVVTDGNGCTTTASAVINEPTSAVTADVSSTNENGATSNDGTATAISEGGTPPYTISWSNGETTETISGLDAGDYTVVVTDANGCRYEETITVASTNQVPAPVNDSTTTSEDTAVEIDVTDNDNFGSDGPNDSVIVITEQPDNGTVTVDDGGTPNDPTDDSVIYTPDPDFNGTDTFEYEITDSNGDSETATVVVTVTGVDDVAADTASTDEDVPVEINVLGNDTFDANADVAVTDVTDPANGTVVINPDGTVIYTPDPDFNGEDTFDYTVTVTNPDGTTTTETATVTVTVNPIADVVDDADTTPEDTPVNIDVLDNDTFEGTNNEVTDVTDPANGTVVINDDGTVTYTPDPDFNGEDTFDYTVTTTNADGTTTTETATVVVTVTGVDDVAADSASTDEDVPVEINVLGNDTFDANADVAVTDVTDPANGTVVINPDGTVIYTPDPDFNGEDTFDYTVTVTNPDGTTTTETATVTVTVNPIADVVDDADTTPEDTPVNIDVLDNDTFEGTNNEVTDVTDPANGTVVINDDGTVTYTPDPDFNGEDTFDYTVTTTNADGTTTTETATVVVTVTGVDDVAADSASTDEDVPVEINVLGNDTFDANADVAVTDVTDPANGTVVINPDGTVIYTPDPDFNGEDTFDYTVTVTNPDGTTTTETATVTVTVNPIADVVDDADTTPEDTPVNIDVLDNDTFEGANNEVTDVTDPANGTVVINDDGTVTYTPDPDFNGEDTFDYTVTTTNADGTTTTETATVVVTVTGVDDVAADSASTDEDVPVEINVLGNDTFDANADVAVTDVTDPANGTVVINPDGTVIYTPDPDFNGEDTFDYTVTVTNPDGTTTTETATVTVTVNPIADVVDDADTTPEDTPVNIDVLDNDTFEGTNNEVTDVTDPANGTVVINDDGTVTYTPDPDFNGEDTFDYTVTTTNADGTTTTETATVVVTVTGVDDVAADSASTDEDVPVEINVLGNDTFDANADVAVTDVTDPANGTVVINPDGTVIYTPDPDFNGEDTFDYTVTVTNPDGTTTTETATVTVTVNPIADVVDDADTTPEDTPVNIDVLDNDTFEGTNNEVTDVTDPANGTVVINDDGTVTYTPDPDFNGEDTFDYTVTVTNPDGTTTTETATVVVTVTPEEDVMDDAETTPEDTPVIIDVLENDGFDPAADVAVTDVTDPANGTVVINDDGTVTYTPDPDFNGEDTFDYTVTVTNPDGTTTTETATVTVTVNPIADVVDDADTTPEDTPVNIDVLDNDTFEGANNEVTDVTDPANGTVVINDDGTVTYTPDPDFNGEDTFDYTVTTTNADGTTTTETATVVVTVTGVDDVAADSASTDEDVPVEINVLGNDTFDANADVAVTDVTDPANGTVVINPDGTVIYTPDPDFNGEDTFDYTVTVTNPDGTTTTETATVTVTVNPIADVVDDADTTPEDTPVNIDVLDNDTFEGTNNEVTDVTDPANGTVVINDDGTVTYTPDPDFNGEDTFDYTVTTTNADGTTTTETATVVVTVTGVDDVAADSASTDEDVPVEINVLGNDTFDANADVAVTDVTDPANGTVVINPDGTVIYTPDPDFNGEDTFDYTVTVTNPDGTTTTETATVTVTVNPIADVVDDADTTPEDTPVNIDVLDNDTFEGANNEVTDVTDPANGTVVINDDGTVTYTPDPDFNGEDTFDYTVTTTNADGTTTTETATVVVTVTGVDDVAADSASTDEDVPVEINVLGNDTFDANADVAVTDVTDPANGTVVINPDGTVIYTPDPDFNGEDTFDYTVTVTNPDGTTTTETATVTVTVNPIADVVDDADTTPEDTPVNIDVLDNDTFEGTNNEVTDVTDPANGTVVINDDGTVTYTPDPDFNGEDTFDYTVTTTNADGTTTTETATVVVTVTGVDDVAADSASTDEDVPVEINVLGNDTFDANADVAVTDVTDPANGTVVINPDGTVIYTPDPDFNGEDTFDYTVTVTNPDGTTTTETATVTVTVNPIADVVDDADTTPEDTPVNIDVLDNDTFEGTNNEVTDVTDPANGTVVINDDGTVTYTPDPDFNGEDTFDYTVTTTNADGTTTTETATVVVTVTGVDDVAADSASTDEDVPVEINVLGNDTFDANADVAVTDVTDPANGTVVINPDGTVIYTPDPDFNGEDTFDYTVTVTNPDGTTTTETATVTVTVNPIADVVDDADTTPEDTPVNIDVLDNDTFEGANNEVTDVTDPANGTVVINDDGTVTYTPDPDFNGEDTFDYTVTTTNADGTTTTETATVVVTVTGVDDVAADSASTDEDVPVEINVLGNDTFDANADVAVTDVTDPANGTVVINPDGTVIYTPDPDFNGEDTFDYTVTVTNPDGTTTTETATVTVTVNPIADVVDDADTTPEDTPVNIDVLDNDTFEGTNNEVTDVTDPANGTVVINDDGTVTYTPDPDFNGEDTFDYTVTTTNADGTTTTETATVVVTVTGVDDVAADSASTDEDVPVEINVLGNDTFDANADVAVTDVTDPANGTVVINPDGTVIYTPDPDFNGEDTFDYTVTVTNPDGTTTTETATVTVTVNPIADVVDDADTTPEDTPVNIDVLDNDTFEGTNNEVTDVTDPANGTVVINDDGTVTYTPDPDFNGEDTFDYTVTTTNADGTTTTETATVVVTVTGVDDVAADSASTDEDVPVEINVLGNDTFDANADVAVTDVTDPANGTVVINPDGTVIYTPDPDFNGEDTFDYTVTVTNPDGTTTTETATVTVTVNPIADVVDDADTTPEDTPVNIDVLDNDTFEGTNNEVTDVTDPANGTVVINDDGTVTYTPDPDFNGEDTFDYTVTTTNADGTTTTETATVVVTVTGVDDVAADSASTDEDVPVEINVLGNDTFDANADVAVTDVTDPANGTVVINPDGTVIYTPDPDFNGEDTFDYTVTVTNPDGTTTTETATVTVTVNPIADVVDDADTTPEDTPVNIDVLDNDTFEGANNEVTDVTDPANGTVVINDDGTVTYTPDPDFNGEDTFDYTVTTTNADGTTTTETATVVVTVTGVDDVAADSASTDEDVPVEINVLGNDTFDANADVAVTDVTDPANGTVVINPDGTVIYTPDPDFNGEDIFDYTVTVTNPDGTTTTETATVTVTVNPIADVVDDADTTPEDTPVNIDVLDNDTFEGTNNEVTDVTDPANGTVVINDDGTVTYTPDPDFNGEDTFDYTVTVTNPDGTTTTETATVVVTVTPEEDVMDDAETTPEDTPVIIDVLENDGFDPAADVAVTDVTDPANGTVVINDDGTVTYTPDPDFNGEDTFDYTVTVTNPNGTTTTETATVVVTVTPEEDVMDDAETTPEDTPVIIDVLENDGFDPAADVAVTDVTDPANGTVVINDDGTVTYTPDPDFNGEDTFDYTVTVTNPDGTTTTETATVVVTVTPEEDVMDDAETTPEDTPVIIDVLENDGFDPAADVAVTDVTDPANGTVVINDDGTVTYTPDPDFNGEDTFDYTVTVTNPDGTTTTETATVVVTVTPEEDVMDDAETTPEDTPVDIDVLDNDTFDPAADVAVTDVTDPANGTVVINDDGTVTYTPDPDFNGEDTFDYTVTVTNPDGTTTTETATVVVTVTPEEDVMDDAETTPEDTPVIIDVLDNDGFDPAADVAVTDVTDPANGTVVINDDGTVTYTPDPDFNGEDTFDYTVTVTNPDGTTTTETATVVVTVTPEEDVMDDAETTPEDTPVIIDVLDNDGFDPAADVAVTDVTDPANGTVVINDDGTVTYTPDPDFNGEDTFDYTVTVTNPDGTTTTETATVVVTVTPEEDVMDDAETTPEDTPVDIDVLDNDTFDPAADVAVTDVTDPANGTVVINDDGTVTYTPDPDFNGEDTFDYTVTVTNPDGTTTTETATVVVTVTPEEDVMDDAETTPEDTPVIIDVLDNDGFDPAADVAVTDVTDPANGTVVINDDGTVTYTPDPDFNGEDTFEYTVTVTNPDGTTTTETATVVVTVTPEEDAVDDTIETPEDTPVDIDVLDNDTFDPAADVEVTDVTDPANGTVVINDDGTVTYTPDPNFNGEDTFDYTVTVTNPDGTTTTETATVVVTVTPDNPSLDVFKEGNYEDTNEDGVVNLGDSIIYNFIVFNNGDVPLSDITLTDELVDVMGGPIDLEVGESDSMTFTAIYAITQEDINTGAVYNQAIATGQDPAGEIATDASEDPTGIDPNNPLNDPDCMECTITVLNQDPEIAIVKTGTFNDEDGDGFAQVGETITYNFTVTNTGNVTVTNIIVTDPLVTVTGGPIDLVPGTNDDTTFIAEYVLTQEDVDAGTVENQALVTGQDPNGDDVVDTSDDNSTVEGEEDITITDLPEDPGTIAIVKTGTFNDEDGDGFAEAGETITYNFTVTNTGNVTVTNIIVTDPLVTVTGGPIDLVPGASDATTFVAEYVLTQDDVDAGMVENQALATGQNPSGDDVEDTSDDDSTVEGDDDITITDLPEDPGAIAIVKTGTFNDEDGDGFAEAGETITYNFTVTNTGNVTVTNIIVTDPLVTVTGGPIDLVPGASDATTFVAEYVLTQDDVDAGMVENQALATGQNPNGDDVEDTSDDDSTVEGDDDITITDLPEDPGAIAIVKTGTFNDEDGDGFAEAGETITYNFTVTNTGNVTVTNIIVTDPLVTVTGGPIDLVPGASDATTFVAEYVLTQDDVDAGMVENQALATGQNPSGDDVEDTSDDDSTVEGDDDITITDLPEDPGTIAIVKTGTFNDEDGDGFAQVGETITYNFTVTNTGNVTVTNIIVTDPLVTVTGGPIDLVPGAIDATTFVAEYVLTQEDVDAGMVENQALATGQNPSGDDVEDTSDDDSTVEGDDDITITDLPEDPGTIAIVKTGTFNDEDGDGFAQVGETITYNFTVTNTGNVTVTNIIVTDPLVTVTGGPIDLVPGAIDATTFVAEYVLTQEDVDAGMVENQALATGQNPSGDDVEDTSDDDSTEEGDDDITITDLPEDPGTIAIVKTGTFNDEDGDGFAQVGETITYNFTVTNTGNVTVTNIIVTDPLVTVTGGPIDLVPGASDATTFVAEYVLTQEDVDAGMVENQALATGQNPSGDDVEDTSDDDSTVEGDDDVTITDLPEDPGMIAIVKTGTFNDEDGDGFAQVGETITYNFTVTNTGNVTVTNIIVTDPLVTVTGGPIDLVPGASDATTFVAEYVLTQEDVDAGMVENQALATGQNPNGDDVEDTSDDDSTEEGEDDITITDLPEDPGTIAIVKTGTFNDEDGDGFAQVGETITYNFTVTNTGNVTVTNIIVTDPLVTVTGGPIDLVPGASDATTFVAEYVLTQEDVDAGMVENQALATGQNPNGDDVEDTSDDDSTEEGEDDVTITDLPEDVGSIAVVKTGTFNDEDGDGFAQAGETITYNFTVSNTGNVTISNIVITDPLVAVTGGPIDLEPGASDATTFVAEYVLTQEDVDAGMVENQALATGQNPNGDDVEDTSDDDSTAEGEEDVTITILPTGANSIALEKTGELIDLNGDGVYEPGEIIQYTFTVTNTGELTIEDIVITDPLVDVEGGPITLLPGESDSTTFTATYLITEEDIENGQVLNQATVSGVLPDGTELMDLSDDPTDDTNVDVNGDGNPDDPTVTIIPSVLNVTDLEVFTGISPDGDGQNDIFIIEGIVDFPDNNVQIFNRWGVQVFEGNGYDNQTVVFRGISDGRATINSDKELPEGTYYYLINYQTEDGLKRLSGYLYINR